MSALGDALDYMPAAIAPGWHTPFGHGYDEWIMTGFPLLEFHYVDTGWDDSADRLVRHA